MEVFAEIERYFWLMVSVTLSLILLAHLYVHLAMKWSNQRWCQSMKAKRLEAKIISGNPDQWCSLYIGKSLVVKPFYNRRGEKVDSLYTVIPCKENKRVLSDADYLRTKYENAWGITLSVGREYVCIDSTE